MSEVDGVQFFTLVGRPVTVTEVGRAPGDAVTLVLSEAGEKGDEKHLRLTLDRDTWRVLTEIALKHC